MKKAKTSNEQPPKIIGFVQDEIRKVFCDNSVKLGVLEMADTYTFVAGPGHLIMVDPEPKRRYSIGLLRPVRTADLCLTLTIQLDLANKVKDLSFSFFEGTDAEDMKKLFRAEWSSNDIGKSHAQPHWQFLVDRPSPIKASWLESKTSFEPNESLGVNRLASKIKDFHFAMEATWSLGAPARKGKSLTGINISETEEREIRSWVSGMLQYAIGQIIS